MSTNDSELAPPPTEPRRRELWLQQAAGFILFEDARSYVRDRIEPGLDGPARQAAERAIDDAFYGLMMIVDGVTGRFLEALCDLRAHRSSQASACPGPALLGKSRAAHPERRRRR